jgi:hypothetical protein
MENDDLLGQYLIGAMLNTVSKPSSRNGRAIALPDARERA